MKHLQTYNVPGTVLGVADAEKRKTDVLPSGSIPALAPSNLREVDCMLLICVSLSSETGLTKCSMNINELKGVTIN